MCAESARVIYSNDLKKISKKIAKWVFGESGGPPSITCTLLSLCPPLLHHIHLTTFTQTDTLSEPILQIGLECVALLHPRRPGKPVTIISPLQGLFLLSADLSCCWLRLTSSQSSTCTELFCFALLDTKMQFSAALSPLIGPSNYPFNGI